MLFNISKRNNVLLPMCSIFFLLSVYLLAARDYNPVPMILRQIQIQGPKVECLPRCNVPSYPNTTEFKKYFTMKEYFCNNFTYFGIGDGSKGVCLDPAFNLNPNDCHVLSFGINNEFSFDDHFGRFGCKVYSFDHTMGKEDHQRSPKVRFFNLGLGLTKTTKVDTYQNILERLNLLEKTIDYLKIDIERAELDFFQDIFRNSSQLLKTINQIGMEVHYASQASVNRFWQYFSELKCHGFKLMDARSYGGRSEVVWGRV